MKPTIICVLILSTLIFFGCKKNESINHLSPSEIQERLEAWKVASNVSSSEQIFGEWKATTKDMPDGSKLVEWVRRFDKEGAVVESIASSEWATGPIRYFRIEKSRLFVSDSPDEKSHEEGEIRTSKGLLFLKMNEGIYVFKQIQK